MLLPNKDMFSEEAIDNVRDTFIRKACNTVSLRNNISCKAADGFQKRLSLNSGCQPTPNASHTPC